MLGRMMGSRWIGRAIRGIPREVIAVWFAARDPATPRAVSLLALAAGLYAVSPIDLVPDLLIGLGWLDDLIVVPTALAVVTRLVPASVMQRARLRADVVARQPRRWLLIGAGILLWLVLMVGLAVWWVLR